jgi:hypothetical protein
MTTDWTIGVRSPADSKDFLPSLCNHLSSEAHPASYATCTEDPYLGDKAQSGRDADLSPLSSAEVKNYLEPYFLAQSVVSEYRLDEWGSIPGRYNGLFL